MANACRCILAVVLLLHAALGQSPTREDLDKQCPPDSILTSEDECKCSLENCPPSQFSCKRGFTLTIAQKGSGKPGDCCDKFICAPDSGKNCTNVICPEIPSCPPDSSRLPAIKSLDDCCAVPQGCQCLPQCEPSKCAPDSVPVIVSEGNGMPGKCCAVYQCEKRDDEESSPNYEEPIPNSQDCLIENVYKKNGMNWTSSDHCTLCTCKDGLPICESFACVPCLRPIPEPGQCCPRCGDTSVQPAHCPPLPDCSQRCPNGHVEDENGCLTCQCRKDCPKDCTIDIGENGEQICRCGPKCFPLENCQKKCLFGFQKDEDDCDICECEKCTKQCSRGYLIDKGLSVCKCQPWLPFGNNATEIGLSVPCSTEENIWRDDGETWFDGCRHCSCIAGREMCSLIHCSPFTCSRPIVNSTLNCCPFCPDDPTTNAEMNHMVCTSPSGGIMLEGENLKLDECTTCVCHNGMALCRGKDCPPTLCSKPKPPAPGECCSTCPPLDATELDPTTIHGGNDAECDSATANDTAWRESSCVSCRCIGTKKNCFTELCDSTNNCKRSLMIKGKCCPICIDKTDKYKLEGMCLHENSSYNNGEEWTVDLCTRCKCMAGQTRCTQKGCPQPCSNVVRQSDHCCSCGADSGPDSRSMPEILYIVVLLLVVCASVALVVCLTRHWRSKKQQIRLRDLGCLPPQYQYKYIRTSPYDAKSSQKIILSEKTSLAPV